MELAWRSDIEKEINDWATVRYPNIPNLGDLTQLTALPEVDLITAGFPCQPVSQAGFKQGVDDERWLFDDIIELVGRMESRPYLFLENVPGLLTTGHGEPFRRVLHGLAAIGYVGRYGIVAAAQVGAPHLRKRWFCVAHPNKVGRHGRAGESARRWRQSKNSGNTSANSNQAGLQGPESEERHNLSPWGASSAPASHVAQFGRYWRAVDRWERITGRRSPDPLLNGQLNAHFVEWMMGYDEGWVTSVGRRRPQIRALGNAVVPQQAAAAWGVFHGH